MADQEIEAMGAVAEALAPLDDAARLRVLNWASQKFAATKALAVSEGVAIAMPKPPDLTRANYETFAELFEAARPTLDREKALVAAYWCQVSQAESSFMSQSLNAELKDLGHGVSNITDALSQLISEKPALILQLKKAGSSKQARKTFKITQEGIKRVLEMVNG